MSKEITKEEIVEIYKRNRFTIAYNNVEVTFTINDLAYTNIYKFSFAIITAENPMNKIYPNDINKKHNNLLEIKLKDLNYKYEKCIGGEGAHCENSFIIYEIQKDEAINLGLEFKQYSIFYNDKSFLTYIECATRDIILETNISRKI